MTTLREAAQQALEALEQSETTVPYEGFGMAHREAERKHGAAITALRSALAQQDEPVAWRYKAMVGMPWSLSDDGYYVSCKRDQRYIIEPLYTDPPTPQQAEPTGKDLLQVPPNIADAMTAADLAWLETRRLVRLWKEFGQMRWSGADEGWDKAIEAVRNRLDKECQDILAWKEKVEASGEAAVQLLQRMKND